MTTATRVNGKILQFVPKDADGNCLAAPGLRGLLETDGLQTVLRALTRGQVLRTMAGSAHCGEHSLSGGRRRRPLLGRAAAVAAECAAGAAPRSPSGKVTRKASEDGKARLGRAPKLDPCNFC